MCEKILVFSLIFFFSLPLNKLSSQLNSFPGQRIIAGSSITYVWENYSTKSSKWHEITWEKNIAINLSKGLYFGLSHKNIFNRYSSITNGDKNDRYYMMGAFAQYDFLKRQKRRIFVEYSINTGNYCLCGPTDLYRKKKLSYSGMGVGFDFPLTNKFSLDLSYMFYMIHGKTPNKRIYTQYIIGVNYDILRFKKKQQPEKS